MTVRGAARLLCAAAAAGVMSLLAYALILEVNTGPVVVTFAPERGLHQRDLYVLAAWSVGMVGLLATLLLAPGRGRRRRP